MKAIVINQFGGREQLKFVDAAKPQIREDDVLVEVHAAAVNPLDWKAREGYLKDFIPHQLPLILGWEFAGTVVETGPNVTKLKIGDEVFGMPDFSRDGAYAEYIAVNEEMVAIKPKEISFNDAASIPAVGLTAWQTLVDRAQVKPGDKVLIHAGAGGVGSFAIQLAKSLGAYVITTGSARNVQFLKDLGADEVINYQDQAFENELKDIDLVFDTLGGEVLRKSFQVLRSGGILLSIVEAPDLDKAKHSGIEAAMVSVKANAEQLEQIAALVKNGTIKPVVNEIIPLEETAKAHEISESLHARGKLIIEVKTGSQLE